MHISPNLSLYLSIYSIAFPMSCEPKWIFAKCNCINSVASTFATTMGHLTSPLVENVAEGGGGDGITFVLSNQRAQI